MGPMAMNVTLTKQIQKEVAVLERPNSPLALADLVHGQSKAGTARRAWIAACADLDWCRRNRTTSQEPQ